MRHFVFREIANNMGYSELYTIGIACFNHGIGIIDCKCNGLLAKNMLSVACGKLHCFSMQISWKADIDNVHFLIAKSGAWISRGDGATGGCKTGSPAVIFIYYILHLSFAGSHVPFHMDPAHSAGSPNSYCVHHSTLLSSSSPYQAESASRLRKSRTWCPPPASY